MQETFPTGECWRIAGTDRGNGLQEQDMTGSCEPATPQGATAAVYRALLHNQSASPARLAELLCVDLEQVRRELATLASYGLVNPAPTDSGYAPVRPDVVREDALRSAEADLERRRVDLAAARQQLAADLDDYF